MGELQVKVAPKKGGRKPKLDPGAVALALDELLGNVSAVARRFGVSRAAVQQLIGRRPELQRVLRDARATMADNVESALYTAALRGEGWAVCFFLKTQARDRGYVERQEVGGGVVVHQIDWAALARGARPADEPDPIRDRLREIAALPRAATEPERGES